jgi:uncharacterized protein (DUF2461 family)
MFTSDFTSFFQELSQNNNSVWFSSNKKRYEKVVQAPFIPERFL